MTDGGTQTSTPWAETDCSLCDSSGVAARGEATTQRQTEVEWGAETSPKRAGALGVEGRAMRADENDMSQAGRTRWVSIESPWTLVLRPGSGWLSRTLAQYAGLPQRLRCVLGLLVASGQLVVTLVFADPSASEPNLRTVVSLLLTVFVVVNAVGFGPSDRAARMWSRLTGGRLVAPVRLNDPVEDDRGMPQEISVHSGCLADEVVRREPHLAGVVHELLWAAAVPGGPRQHAVMRSATTDELVDDAWKAWVQVAERALSRPAPGSDQ